MAVFVIGGENQTRLAVILDRKGHSWLNAEGASLLEVPVPIIWSPSVPCIRVIFYFPMYPRHPAGETNRSAATMRRKIRVAIHTVPPPLIPGCRLPLATSPHSTE
jgi:hypothetical protein